MKAIADENISMIDKYAKALAAAQSETMKLQNLLENVKTTKFENPAGAAFYNGLTQAQIDLEKFKERGGFRLKWDASEYYRGLTQGEIDLEKFKEKGGFRLKWNATDYYIGLTQGEIDLEKFKEKGLFRLKWSATDYYSGLTNSEILLEKLKEKGMFRLTWDATDFYRGLTAAQITWERWKESGYKGPKPGSPIPTDSNVSSFADVPVIVPGSTQNTNSNSSNIVVNINAGVVGSEDVIIMAVQNALNELTRRGNSITYAGAIS
jgi:5-hydroxyisourate hydrolase-like protein (transthyretin family)